MASSSETACGSGALVHAVERLAPAPGEQLGDRLVGEDHQLLDQRVRVPARDSFQARATPPLPSNSKLVLGALDPQRAAGEAAAAQLGGDVVREPERLGQRRLRALAPGEDRLRLAVREPRGAADHRAVEVRLAVGPRTSTVTHEPVVVRAQAAEVVGDLVRQHRRDHSRARRSRAPAPLRRGRAASRPGRTTRRRRCAPSTRIPSPSRRAEIASSKSFAVSGSIVNVDQLAQVDAAFEARLGRLVRLEGSRSAALDEQPLEHGLDRARRAEHTLEPRAPASGAHDGKVAGPRVAEPVPVERERRPGREERLADDELSAPGDLDDDDRPLGRQTFRKRRSVRPEPAAPRSRPTPIRISAFSENEIACTSEPR